MNHTYLVHLSENPAEGQKESFVLVEAQNEQSARTEALETAPDKFGVYAVFMLDLVSGTEALPTNRNLFPQY